MESIKFGTDGWRAIIAEDFTFDNVRRVSQATADYFSGVKWENRLMVVSYDRRFASEDFARATAEVLAGNGYKVLFSSETAPTPSACVTLRNNRCRVVITASHNPGRYNGFKVKTSVAGPAPPEVTQAIEKLLGKSAPKTVNFDKAAADGAIRVMDFRPAYFEAVTNYVDIRKIRNAGFAIVMDPLWGAGRDDMAQVLAGSSCKVTTIHGNRDAFYGGLHPEPTPRVLAEAGRTVAEKKADIGLATDGDADRLGAISSTGQVIDSHHILALLLYHFVNNRKIRGEVVQTVSVTRLIGKMCKAYDLPLTTTPVGFKNIARIMAEREILLGGEESGGLGVRGHVPERDGLLCCLLLLELMAMTGRGIQAILDGIHTEFGKAAPGRVDRQFPRERIDKLPEAFRRSPPKAVAGRKVKTIDTMDGWKLILEDGLWLLVRASGTEPLLRLYAETLEEKQTNALLKAGEALLDTMV